MITGLISDLSIYGSLHPNLARAIGHVLQIDLPVILPGKYEPGGTAFFYMVNEYFTKAAADCEPERHRQYTDIQIMIEGCERFGCTPYSGQLPSTDFMPDNDVAFYKIPGSNLDYITLEPGRFILFTPADIHQPEVFAGSPAQVRKLVVKVDMS